MNMITQCDIYVYMDWPEDAEPVYMGVLHSETIRGKEVFSYENDPAWLAHPRFRALDPGDVRLCAGGKLSTPGCRTGNRERLPRRIT